MTGLDNKVEPPTRMLPAPAGMLLVNSPLASYAGRRLPRVATTMTDARQASELIEARKKAALDYHEFPTPGKISVTPTKQLVNQTELALAYSPGVAAACEAIVEDPLNAFRFTSRGNLVGVITNGTAVLGLGAIGPLAAKPVMEGKAVLFKKFAGIDVFDIEIEERDPQKLVDVIAALEPTFGGINLEDIKAPECFFVERELRRRMKIPVFHDDQHGTAIIVGAAVFNGLQVVDKDIGRVKIVVSGAGAAALACVDLLLDLGVRQENVWLPALAGEVYQGIESGHGQVGYYVVSDGTAKPYRVHMRYPGFTTLQALETMCKGRMLADLVAVIGSIDIVLVEIDR